MGAAQLLVLFLGGSPGVEIVREESPPARVVRSERALDRDDVRTWYTRLAARTTKRTRMPAHEAVPQLVALHALLGDVPGLSSIEKQRMRATLRGRIEWYGHRLRKRVVATERSPGNGRTGESAAGGDASRAGARALIDLIQRTVDPPIWDVNGGVAGIGYFAPYHALVVRAPGVVHLQLGDTLDQVRRVQP